MNSVNDEELNPVEQAIMWFAKDWQDNLAQGTQLLVWEAKPSTLNLISCFVTCHNPKVKKQYNTGTHFYRLETPYENAIQYARDIKVAWVIAYAKYRSAQPDHWLKLSEELPHTASGFNSLLQQVLAQTRESTEIGLYLCPSKLSEAKYFEQWVARFLLGKLLPNVHLLMVDRDDAVQFPGLQTHASARVYRSKVPVEGWKVAAATFNSEPAKNEAAEYRNLMITVFSTLEKGTANEVNASARPALDFAREQKWPEQEAALRMIVAGAYLKECNFEKAITVYQAALGFIVSDLRGTAMAYPLATQCLIGEAGTKLVANDFEGAKEAYLKVCEMAKIQGDPKTEVDMQRLAAFCCQQSHDKDGALNHGVQALKSSQSLSIEDRQFSTASTAATDLLKTTDSEAFNRLLDIKLSALASNKNLLALAEQKAVQLENEPDKRMELHILEVLATEEARYDQIAKQELDIVQMESSPEFQRAFSIARETFGSAWPLRDEMALAVSEEQVKYYSERNVA